MPDSNDQLAQYVFVVFADDWGRHPSSCQHLFRRIIPQAQVIWVNTIGLRTPRINLHDLGRALQVMRSWIRPNARFKARSGANPASHAVNTRAGIPWEDSVFPYVLSPVMWPSSRDPGPLH